MIFEHNLAPVALNFFGINIYWYSLSYLFGFIFFIHYSKYLIKKKFFHLELKLIDNFLGHAILGVILGGRLGYVFFYNFDFYLQNPFEIVKIWKGGMSFHGGLLGVLISMIIFSKNNKFFLELSNIVSCSAPFGIFLGRIANFINAELIGRPTSSNWGILYSDHDYLRHPSQIYSAIFEGLIILVILFFFLHKGFHKKVNVFSIFLLLYSVSRFIIEFFRQPDPHLGFVFLNLTLGQILCIPMLFLGIMFLTYGKKSI